MKSEKLISLLGYSIKSESLEKLVQELKIDTELRDFHKSQKHKYKIDLRNDLNDIILIFDGYIRYKEEYGEPKEIINTSDDELILTQIFFYNEDENARTPFSIELPFSLKFKDSIDNIILKLGKKPNDKLETDDGFCLFFMMSEFEIIVFLNNESKLMMLRIIKHDEIELEKIRLKKEIRSQRKNINPENVPTIQSLSEKIPTIEWKIRMKGGDNIFTEKNITEIELALLEYIECLSEFTKARKVSNIFNSVKKITRKINKINSAHNYFIHTTEREELCEFIDEIIRATGFKLKNGIDITEEWRNW